MSARKKPNLSEEICTIARSGEGGIRVALAFPNTYHVGMSNLGFQSVYRILNLAPGITCERAFLPEAKTILHLKKANKHLTSFETGQQLGSFHVIAFSLSFENDYLNILTMLSLAGIPFLQNKRRPLHPLIIGGGVAVFLNPEPLAEIFDLFVIGEAEEVLEELADKLKEHYGSKGRRKPGLSVFADIEGVYVPSLYDIKYNSSGLIEGFSNCKGAPDKIRCRKIADLNAFTASSCIRTPHTEFADMALIEVSRGCPRLCRFCAVGSIYKPFRKRKISNLLEQVQPFLREQSKIGLLGSAISDHPQLADLIKSITMQGCHVSVSSLRADALTEEIVLLLKESGLRTLTIAPEAGTERLRQVISKNLTDEEIFRAVKIMSRSKVPNIKLYFLIGLPNEREEDIKAIVNITKEIKHIYFKEARSERRLNRISLSISSFVPKPFTPFQWHPYEQVRNLKQKIKVITNGLKKEKKVVVNYELPKWGYVQCLLSRADRRVGRILLSAFENNADWPRTFRETDINPDFYVYREKSFDEILPWDFIDHGIDKKKLWKEYQEALNSDIAFG
jgi:radical SAM family uncharacterized protein